MNAIKMMSISLALAILSLMTIATASAKADKTVAGTGVSDAGVAGITGGAIAGIVVALESNGQAVATTTTDDQGHFSFANVRVGTYDVKCSTGRIDDDAAKSGVSAMDDWSAPVTLQVTMTPRDAMTGQASGREASTGMATGKRMHSPVTITKTYDKTTPMLSITVPADMDADVTGTVSY